jgi:hypothetical protein
MQAGCNMSRRQHESTHERYQSANWKHPYLE